jgi:N-acetylglucosaminyldiphosphoundecaprenol N-acetyl-beta-D-mannosaminyltransferase
MTNRKVRLFEVDIDALNMLETVEVIDRAIAQGNQLVHNCINANKVVLMQKDDKLRTSLEEADIISADGQAVVWVSGIYGRPLPERVPGIDLMENLMSLSDKKGYKVYLLGAKQEIVEAVTNHYNKLFSKPIIAGFHNGYFDKEGESLLLDDINKSGAQLLFVAIPSPQKELFIKRNKDSLKNVSLLMGVGGSFDVIAGKVKRAPRWMQDNGLEWLYRLIQEPRKMWKRYLLGNIHFVLLSLKLLRSRQ